MRHLRLGIFILLLLGIFLRAAYRVEASPPAPAPRCRIEGLIQESVYKQSEPDKPGGPTDAAESLPERYALKVKILKSQYEDGDQSLQTCAQLYKAQTVRDMVITSDKITVGQTPRRGQKITGIVRTFWWPSFDTFELSAGPETFSFAYMLQRLSDFLQTIRITLRQ